MTTHFLLARPSVIIAAAVTLLYAQKRSFWKNHLFFPVLNFSSMSPLTSCRIFIYCSRQAA